MAEQSASYHPCLLLRKPLTSPPVSVKYGPSVKSTSRHLSLGLRPSPTRSSASLGPRPTFVVQPRNYDFSQFDPPQYSLLNAVRHLQPFVPVPNRRTRRALAWSRLRIHITSRRPLKIACTPAPALERSRRIVAAECHASHMRRRSLGQRPPPLPPRSHLGQRPPQPPSLGLFAGVSSADRPATGRGRGASYATGSGRSTRATTASSRYFTVRFLIDGGSNANFTYDERLPRHSHFISARGSIGGISGGLSYTGVAHCATSIGAQAVTLAFLYTPGGTKNILSESVLLAEYGILTVKPSAQEACLRLPDGSTAPLVYEEGLWYIDLHFSTLPPTDPPDAMHSPVAHAAEALVAAIRADDLALLWAARFEAGSDMLKGIARAVRGVPLEKLSKTQEEAVESNQHRALGQAKHSPVGSTTLRDRATAPGELLIVDGFGENHSPSPLDGATYQFHAVDEFSSYGYVGSGTSGFSRLPSHGFTP